MRRARAAWGLLTSDDEKWRLQAACRGEDPTWWELTPGNKHTGPYRQAHQICASCPVWRDCLQMAERTGSEGLIFGGVDFGGAHSGRARAVFYANCRRCGRTYGARNRLQTFCSPACRVLHVKDTKQKTVA